MDLDTLYAGYIDYQKLRPRLMKMLEAFEAHAAEADRRGSPSDILALGSESPSGRQEQARAHVRNGLLQEAGRLLGLDKVSKANGHPFDETDRSYETRLRSGLGMADLPPEDGGDQNAAQISTETETEADAPKQVGVLNYDGEVHPLRDDGPTIAEFLAEGYPAKAYPPSGFSSRSTQAEIDAAVAASGQTNQKPDEVAAERTQPSLP
jgi:hypothetical protein